MHINRLDKRLAVKLLVVLRATFFVQLLQILTHQVVQQNESSREHRPITRKHHLRRCAELEGPLYACNACMYVHSHTRYTGIYFKRCLAGTAAHASPAGSMCQVHVAPPSSAHAAVNNASIHGRSNTAAYLF